MRATFVLIAGASGVQKGPWQCTRIELVLCSWGTCNSTWEVSKYKKIDWQTRMLYQGQCHSDGGDKTRS